MIYYSEPEVPVPESPHAPLHKYLPNSGDTNFFKVDPRDLELSETSDIEKRGKVNVVTPKWPGSINILVIVEHMTFWDHFVLTKIFYSCTNRTVSIYLGAWKSSFIVRLSFYTV